MNNWDINRKAQALVNQTMLTNIGAVPGGFGMDIEGGACGLLAEAFAQQLVDSGADNYIELSFTSSEVLPGERLVVTLHRFTGLTPTEKLAAAERKIVELEQQLASKI